MGNGDGAKFVLKDVKSPPRTVLMARQQLNSFTILFQVKITAYEFYVVALVAVVLMVPRVYSGEFNRPHPLVIATVNFGTGRRLVVRPLGRSSQHG